MTSKATPLDRVNRREELGRTGDGAPRLDPEVPQRARRRTFTATYKLKVLAEYDAAPDGEKGALLRREGLYSSLIVEWRRARDAGALAALAVPRGRKRRDPQQERIADLEADNQRLEQELAKARFVMDVQAKLHALLETLSESADAEPRSTP
jgi:transposase